MKNKSTFIASGLVLGALLTVGASASAFYGGALSADALKNFSSEQKEAITKAFEIRATAHEEAKAVLDAAQVDREALRTAMHAGREAHRAGMEAALESGDYEAAKALVSGSPFEERFTEEVFKKLVEAHALREAGDFTGAREIMEELDMGMGGFGSHGGPRHGMRR